MSNIRNGQALTMKTLVFGSMPDGARPESHIAAGSWCFAGREAFFPGWDGSGAPDAAFPLPPDPYSDGKSIREAALAANGAALLLIDRLAKIPAPDDLSRNGSRAFSQTAFGPFALLVCHMFAERQQRVLDLIRLYRDTPLRVGIVPNAIPFSFTDSVDFMLRGVQDAVFNHYVYSRILEATAPTAWRLDALPLVSLARAEATKRRTPRALIKDALLRLPFPRLKGFGPVLPLLLSCAALLNDRKQADRSFDLAAYSAKPTEWLFPAEELAARCMPLSLKRAVQDARRNLGHPLPEVGERAKKRPLRIMSPVYSQNDPYRIRLALLRHRGYRLASVQHGANYGNLESIGGIALEYAQHAFFTWGWTAHAGTPVNAHPLPHPTLARIAGKHREKSPALILVGTEMSTYSYRLKSRPQAGALPAYRQSKTRFLSLMERFFENRDTSGPETPKPALYYRPYFKVAGGLEDADHIRRVLPAIGICTGDLTEHMLSCRLLVLDHYGTTLHMALISDTPCLAFWKDEDWSMELGSREYFALMHEAGILHRSADDAARKAQEVWPDIEAWWKSNGVQKARRSWLKQFALAGSGGPVSMRKLAATWWRTLRRA